MKITLLKISLAMLLLCGMRVTIRAQTSPALSNVHFTDKEGIAIDANGLQKDQPVRLNMTLFNFSPVEEIPAGKFELTIELGNAAALPHNIDVKKLPYTGYIAWDLKKEKNGNTFLYGKIIKPLPVNFVGRLQLELRCTESSKSEIKTAVYSQGKMVTGSMAETFFTVISK